MVGTLMAINALDTHLPDYIKLDYLISKSKNYPYCHIVEGCISLVL